MNKAEILKNQAEDQPFTDPVIAWADMNYWREKDPAVAIEKAQKEWDTMNVGEQQDAIRDMVADHFLTVRTEQ